MGENTNGKGINGGANGTGRTDSKETSGGTENNGATGKYLNEDRKCECEKCELAESCVYCGRYQRLPRETGGLSKCAKLKENKGKLQY